MILWIESPVRQKVGNEASGGAVSSESTRDVALTLSSDTANLSLRCLGSITQLGRLMDDDNHPYFEFAVSQEPRHDNGACVIPIDDVGALQGVAKAIQSVLSTFASRVTKVVANGDRYRVYLGPSPPGKQLKLSTSEDDIPGLISLTVGELRANAEKQTPLPHRQALTSTAMVSLLHAVTAQRTSLRVSPTYTDSRGTYSLPKTNPEIFIEPRCEENRVRSGTLEVYGVSRGGGGMYYLQLTRELIRVAIGSELCAQIEKMSLCSVIDGLWYEGSITKSEDGTWVAATGGKFINQDELPLLSVA